MIPHSLKSGRFFASEDGPDISKCINTKISKACVLLMLMFIRPSSFLIAHKLVCVACEDKASISYCQFSAVEFQTTICPLFFSGICNGRNKRTRVKNRYVLTKRHVLLLRACDDFIAGAHAELDNVKNVYPARFVLKKRYRFR